MKTNTTRTLLCHSIKMALVVCVTLTSDDCFSADPPVSAVVFSPNLESVVTGSQAGVTTYSWPELKRQQTTQVAFDNVHDLAFSPQGDVLAVAGGHPTEDGLVELISWPSMQSLQVLDGHTDSVSDVCWIDDRTVATAGMDHNVLIWDLTERGKRQSLLGHSHGVLSVDYLGSDPILVSAGIDQSVRVWDYQSSRLVRSMAIHIKPVSSIAVRPTRPGLPMIASASDDGTVRFWQPTIGRMVRFARLPSSPRDIQWLSDGTKVVACCNDGNVYLVDPNTVNVSDSIKAVDGWAYALEVHPKGHDAVVGGGDGSVRRIALPQMDHQ